MPGFQTVGGVTDVIETSITRPDNTTGYGDGDAVTDSTSAPSASQFELGRVNGGSGLILAVTIIDSVKGTRPTTGFDLFLFDSAPTATNDNSAFALTDADAKNILPGTPIVLTESDHGVDSGANNAVLCRSDIVIPYKCASSSDLIYGLLVMRGTYTPAEEEVFTIRLGVAQD